MRGLGLRLAERRCVVIMPLRCALQQTNIKIALQQMAHRRMDAETHSIVYQCCALDEW